MKPGWLEDELRLSGVDWCLRMEGRKRGNPAGMGRRMDEMGYRRDGELGMVDFEGRVWIAPGSIGHGVLTMTE